MLRIQIVYPLIGSTRTYGVTQMEANKLITHISNLNEREPVDVKVIVGDWPAFGT